MKVFRVLLFLPGLAALAWGVVLFVEFAFPLGPQTVSSLGFLLGGPLVHDALVAPVAGLAGWAISRVASPRWRAPLITGAVLSGVLTLLSVPLLWRPFGGAVNPGLHDADTLTGLLVSLCVVWALVVATGLTRQIADYLGHRPSPK